MALPHRITKLEDVAEAHREHYTKDGDAFVLDVTGGEDTGALKRGLEAERQRVKDAATARDKAAKDLADLQTEHEKLLKNNVPKDNLTALEASYNQRIQGLTTEKDGKIASLTASVEKLLVDNVAQTMATTLAKEGSAAVLMPHIRARLAVEEVNGEYQTRVLDATGKPSALTPADLSKEIASNAAFAPVLSGSSASGGGSTGGRPGGGATGGKKPDFATASAQEIAAWVQAQPEHQQQP